MPESKATIKADPQHVPNGVVNVHFETNYTGTTVPTDVHVYIKKLSLFRGGIWKRVYDVPHFPPAMVFPIKTSFEKPTEPGTYDIQVVFTHNGVPIDDGERTGQFFVDP